MAFIIDLISDNHYEHSSPSHMGILQLSVSVSHVSVAIIQKGVTLPKPFLC